MGETLRSAFESGLARRPVETAAGVVLGPMITVALGSPSGGHDVPPVWVYARRNVELEMVFQFYDNFTTDDLVCKVVPAGDYPHAGEGASVQFNSKNFKIEATVPVLTHHGKLTLRHGISRENLFFAMETVCPRAMDVANIRSPQSWPVRIGAADNLPELLDGMFVYAYCIEQAKRHLGGRMLLDPLPELPK